CRRPRAGLGSRSAHTRLIRTARDIGDPISRAVRCPVVKLSLNGDFFDARLHVPVTLDAILVEGFPNRLACTVEARHLWLVRFLEALGAHFAESRWLGGRDESV